MIDVLNSDLFFDDEREGYEENLDLCTTVDQFSLGISEYYLDVLLFLVSIIHDFKMLIVIFMGYIIVMSMLRKRCKHVVKKRMIMSIENGKLFLYK